jgi:hypothetical protein
VHHLDVGRLHPFSASARLSTKAPSAPLSTATGLPLRSCIERMPRRPTTASAPWDTSTTRMARGCSPSTARLKSSSRLITMPSIAWLR